MPYLNLLYLLFAFSSTLSTPPLPSAHNPSIGQCFQNPTTEPHALLAFREDLLMLHEFMLHEFLFDSSVVGSSELP